MTHSTHQRRHTAVGRRHRLKFWAFAVLLCLVAALLVLGIRAMFESVGDSHYLRYEPVDVPPAAVSPRHAREREEVERRARKLEEPSQR